MTCTQHHKHVNAKVVCGFYYCCIILTLVNYIAKFINRDYLLFQLTKDNFLSSLVVINLYKGFHYCFYFELNNFHHYLCCTHKFFLHTLIIA